MLLQDLAFHGDASDLDFGYPHIAKNLVGRSGHNRDKLYRLQLPTQGSCKGCKATSCRSHGSGEPRRTRTSNPLIKSQLLYRLS